jgi:hypothetical protein
MNETIAMERTMVAEKPTKKEKTKLKKSVNYLFKR